MRINGKRIKLTIKFSKMWDKLSTRVVGRQFTTLRLIKYAEYYYKHIGDEFIILYRRRVLGKALLEKVEVIQYENITDSIVKADTFSTWSKKDFDEQMIKYYGTLPEQMLMLTLRWIEVRN